MSALVLDAGALIAVDRNDRPVMALLRAVDILPVDEPMARTAGTLLARAGAGDAIDSTVVVVAQSGDRILTSDPQDIRRLAEASGKRLVIVSC